MSKFKWEDVSKYIGKAAPLVGSLFGPAGSIIGEVVSTLLGVENSPDAVVEALKKDPDALVKLKQYEMTHKLELQKLQLETLKVKINRDIEVDKNVTERHANDMRSDNQLSKNIRPMSLIMGFMMLVIIIGLDTHFSKMVGNVRIGGVSPEIIQQTYAMLIIMLKFYFGGRTIEKITGGAIQKTIGSIMSKIKPATQEKY